MPFYAYLPEQFGNDHENIFFRKITELLKQKYQYSPETIYLVGNFHFNGTNVDAILIKKKAIIIIEFKDFGGKISIPSTENGVWTHESGKEVKGGSFTNPYKQIYRYKEILTAFLNNRKVSYNPWNVIKGVVVFHQKVEFDETKLNKVKVWFNVCDITSFLDTVEDVVSTNTLLSEVEIQKIIQSLEVENFPFPPPVLTKPSPFLINSPISQSSEDENWEYRLDIVNAARSFHEVEQNSVYMCPNLGGPYKHKKAKFLGYYKEKNVPMIYEIKAVVVIEKNFKSAYIRWNNSDKTKEELVIESLNIIAQYDYRKEYVEIEEGLQVFLLEKPVEVNFRKETKGGMFGSKIFKDFLDAKPKNSAELAAYIKSINLTW